MEELPNFESRESVIDGLIEELAGREAMDPDVIISDLITYLEIAEEGDESATEFHAQVAEMIGVSKEEMIEYAKSKAQ